MLPTPGSFLRPVGREYRYCYQVMDVLEPCEEWPRGHLTMKRWGLDENRQPVDDGHLGNRYLAGLTQMAPDIWKDEWEHDTPRWMCCPLYYRRIEVGGQKELF